MNVYDLKDRVAIVTGGAQGIGLAVTNRRLASGARVAIWDRDRPLLDETVKRLAQPDRVRGSVIDIADLAAVEAATKGTLDHFGNIDILINNAAIVGPNALTWEYPPEAFRDVVNVGLIGTFYCCRAVAPKIVARAAASGVSWSAELRWILLRRMPAFWNAATASAGSSYSTARWQAS